MNYVTKHFGVFTLNSQMFVLAADFKLKITNPHKARENTSKQFLLVIFLCPKMEVKENGWNREKIWKTKKNLG